MHEYSIVQALLNQCEETARANKATKVKKIVVKIGVMSGVEVDLLKIAYDTFKEGTMCEEADIQIIHQKIVIRCHNCKKESTLEKNEYACPLCQSVDLDVIDGEEMYLMQLELV